MNYKAFDDFIMRNERIFESCCQRSELAGKSELKPMDISQFVMNLENAKDFYRDDDSEALTNILYRIMNDLYNHTEELTEIANEHEFMDFLIDIFLNTDSSSFLLPALLCAINLTYLDKDIVNLVKMKQAEVLNLFFDMLKSKDFTNREQEYHFLLVLIHNSLYKDKNLIHLFRSTGLFNFFYDKISSCNDKETLYHLYPIVHIMCNPQLEINPNHRIGLFKAIHNFYEVEIFDQYIELLAEILKCGDIIYPNIFDELPFIYQTILFFLNANEGNKCKSTIYVLKLIIENTYDKGFTIENFPMETILKCGETFQDFTPTIFSLFVQFVKIGDSAIQILADFELYLNTQEKIEELDYEMKNQYLLLLLSSLTYGNINQIIDLYSLGVMNTVLDNIDTSNTLIMNMLLDSVEIIIKSERIDIIEPYFSAFSDIFENNYQDDDDQNEERSLFITKFMLFLHRLELPNQCNIIENKNEESIISDPKNYDTNQDDLESFDMCLDPDPSD